jgi:uncharacterized protein YdaU (DUF1376 family)
VDSRCSNRTDASAWVVRPGKQQHAAQRKANAVAHDDWFPFYVGKYLKDANHLSQGEHGAYLGLLLYYYGKSAPIPHSRRYAIAYAHAEQEQCNVDAVLAEFFERDGDEWRHSFADRQLKKRADLSEKRSQAAGARWDKEHASADPIALQKHTHQHLHQHKEEKGEGGVGEIIKSLGGGLGEGYDVRDHLSDIDWQEAQLYRSGRHMPDLVAAYNVSVSKKGRPRNDKAAFIGWLKKGRAQQDGVVDA